MVHAISAAAMIASTIIRCSREVGGIEQQQHRSGNEVGEKMGAYMLMNPRMFATVSSLFFVNISVRGWWWWWLAPFNFQIQASGMGAPSLVNADSFI